MISKKNNKKQSGTVKAGKVRDYSNDPFFVQKAEAAKKVIEKYGIPKQLQTGKK